MGEKFCVVLHNKLSNDKSLLLEGEEIMHVKEIFHNFLPFGKRDGLKKFIAVHDSCALLCYIQEMSFKILTWKKLIIFMCAQEHLRKKWTVMGVVTRLLVIVAFILFCCFATETLDFQ